MAQAVLAQGLKLGFGGAMTFDTARQTLQTRQSNLADLQAKLTEGKRVIRASDDPITNPSRRDRRSRQLEQIRRRSGCSPLNAPGRFCFDS